MASWLDSISRPDNTEGTELSDHGLVKMFQENIYENNIGGMNIPFVVICVSLSETSVSYVSS